MISFNLPNFITTFVFVFVILMVLSFIKSKTAINIPGVA